MGRITTRHPVVRFDAHHPGGVRTVDTLAVEEPLEIRLSDASHEISFTTTMRTPGHDLELVHGLLGAERVIDSADDIASARYCTGTVMDEETGQPRNTYNVFQVRLAPGVPLPTQRVRATTTSSACGICGTATIDQLRQSQRFDLRRDAEPLSTQLIVGLPDALRAAQKAFSTTGGTHAAGLFSYTGELLVTREDIGRHNAVDKVVGWAMTNGYFPASQCVLMVSGRIGFELAQKSVLAGIPVLAGISAPTSLAIQTADETGLTLAGFVRGDRISAYSHPERFAEISPAASPVAGTDAHSETSIDDAVSVSVPVSS